MAELATREFTMPSLGADMEAGRLLEWYVRPGDAVRRGDIVALIDTDKAAIEVEIFEDGVVGELLVPPGEKVPVGTALATIRPPAAAEDGPRAVAPGAAATPAAAPAVPVPTPDVDLGARAPAVPPAPSVPAAPGPAEQPAAPVRARPHATPAARRHAHELGLELADVVGSGRHGVVTKADVVAAAAAAPALPATPAAAPEGRPRVSPLARRLARERGVELAGIAGTGPGGSVVRADVERVAGTAAAPDGATPTVPAAPPRAPAAMEGEERYAAMRRAIAAAMAKSSREIPHYYLSTTIDMSAALAWLERSNAERPVTARLLPAALLLRATALAAREVPEMNGFWLDDGFRPADAVHLGVGISLRQGGLIAPALHDADTKDLETLMAELHDLVGRARALRLRSSELTDATLTVTMLGDRGVESVYGVIYPPQVALVGFGRIGERPWAEGGMVGTRPVVQATLAADHRASDGHRGGLFLAAIDRHLQHPEAP